MYKGARQRLEVCVVRWPISASGLPPSPFSNALVPTARGCAYYNPEQAIALGAPTRFEPPTCPGWSLRWAVVLGRIGVAKADPTGTRRRQSNVNGGRTERFVVKVTPTEAAELRNEAERQSVTVSRLLVESVLTVEPSVTAATGMTRTERENLMTGLWSLRRSISGVANNINQIARFANETGAFPTEAEQIKLVTREMLLRVEEFITEFYPASQVARERSHLSAKAQFLDDGWRRRATEIVAVQSAEAVDVQSQK